MSFIDWLTSWVEALSVKDKTAQTVATLLVNEIFPRFGASLELVTDKGLENVNEVRTHAVKSLNIHHITTSHYHLQGNVKVEHFHRLLGDLLTKLSEGENEN